MCFSGLSWLYFEAECVSYFNTTLGAVQPDPSPVEISSLPNIGNLCADPLSTLPPTSFPFSPWLQSITLQNSRTLFSLISICLRSINADILRSICVTIERQSRLYNEMHWRDVKKKNAMRSFCWCAGRLIISGKLDAAMKRNVKTSGK